jgi:hypothetical protein
MKQVTFKKDHVSGIKAGHTASLGDKHAERLRDEGFVDIEGDAPGGGDKEPETIEHTLTKADIKGNKYPGIAEDAKPGDVIQIPNPKYVENV